MAKKKNLNQKILLMTDSACDIPDEELIAGGIVMLPIPIAIDGKAYLERVDFTPEEFYERLVASKELPVTSHILAGTFQAAYEDALENGYTDVILTTITSRGSNMFQAAVFAKKTFFEEHPDTLGRFHITVLDSGSYTAGYGYPIIEASRMIQSGALAEEIIAFLDDFYSCCEIVFATYSLEYARRSGRIPVAAAFVGDVLGLRPIISIVDGVTTTVEKVRGDKNVITRIVEYAYGRASGKKEIVAIVYGSVEEYADNLAHAVSKRFGRSSRVCYQVGASISINAGPKVVGVILRGEKRINTRAREQDFLTD